MTFRPVTQTSAICAACDPTASSTETARPTRYGRRNPSSRTNVERYGTALTALRLELGECAAHERKCAVEPLAVRGHVQPAARSGGMRQWNERCAVEVEPLADAFGELRAPEQRAQGQAAHRDDQLRPQELELPAAPERAQLLLARRRRAGAAPRRGATGI